ncbi:CNTN1 isoform 4, partial [Pan troglodytes]
KHSIEVPIPRDGEYVVEVRAHSDGGDGVVSQVKISEGKSTSLRSKTAKDHRSIRTMS